MGEWERVTIDPAFTLRIPTGWVAEPDEEEGVSISGPDSPGLLHIVAFPQPPGEAPDPAEELYAFLEDQGIDLEEDEVEDMELGEGAELSFCEYLAEDEEEGETTYWMVGVATASGKLLFVSYSCPAGEEERERETIREVLASLRLTQSA